MNSPIMLRMARLAAAGLMVVLGARFAAADTVVDQWSSIKTPPPPPVKSVKIDPQKTAFLILDVLPRICNGRPDCKPDVAKIAAFLKQARAHHMPVIYSIIGGAKPSQIIKDVAPKGNEPYVTAHADKFIGTDLASILKKSGVTTVIATGGAFEGAVLYTSSHAAFIGYKVIVPLDGAFSGDKFAELSSAYILTHAPGVGQATTLTTFDKMSF